MAKSHWLLRWRSCALKPSSLVAACSAWASRAGIDSLRRFSCVLKSSAVASGPSSASMCTTAPTASLDAESTNMNISLPR